MSPPERGVAYDEMNPLIAALHWVDPVRVTLRDFGRAGNYFERQIARWPRQPGVATERRESMARLIEWLPRHIPPGDETSIVHGDYRLDNLIFDPHAPRITTTCSVSLPSCKVFTSARSKVWRVPTMHYATVTPHARWVRWLGGTRRFKGAMEFQAPAAAEVGSTTCVLRASSPIRSQRACCRRYLRYPSRRRCPG
ncbi:MAG TPA: phosphotransferase [Burkholderiaceae bacterium]|nr:phosphotransferase [Burkholderiaceae bacterium]